MAMFSLGAALPDAIQANAAHPDKSRHQGHADKEYAATQQQRGKGVVQDPQQQAAGPQGLRHGHQPLVSQLGLFEIVEVRVVEAHLQGGDEHDSLHPEFR